MHVGRSSISRDPLRSSGFTMGGCGSAEVPPEGQEAGLAVVTSQSSTSGTSSAKDCDYSFKILLIGDSGTALLWIV